MAFYQLLNLAVNLLHLPAVFLNILLQAKAGILRRPDKFRRNRDPLKMQGIKRRIYLAGIHIRHKITAVDIILIPRTL